MPTIKVSITDKRATVEGAPVIICGNSDYSVAFTFDDEWSAHSTKTARFAYKQGGEFRYEDKIFSGTTCAVPVLIDTDLVAIGVYAGNLRTSTPAAVKCAPSVLCLGKLPADPLPSVYNQLITLINTRTPADAAWHNVTANALKGSASGDVVKLTDVSPVEHELGIRVHGKNLFNYGGWDNVTATNGEVTKAEDGVITLTATENDCYTNYTNFPQGVRIPAKAGDVFTFSWDTDTAAEGTVFIFPDGEPRDWANGPASQKSLTFTAPADCEFLVFRLGVANAGDTLKYWNLQIEKGDTATEYEAWVDPTSSTVTVGGVSYTPDEYGVVAGVASLAPTTTLLTDTAGVVIDVTYNRDITKAINALEQALLANN